MKKPRNRLAAFFLLALVAGVIALAIAPPAHRGEVAALALMSTFLIALGVSNLLAVAESKAAPGWPTTEGKIESATLTVVGDAESGDVFRPDVAYCYRVGDRDYRGERIWVSHRGFPSEADAREILQRYAAGRGVRVFHHPTRPERSVLEPVPLKQDLFTGAALALGAACLAALLLIRLAF